MKTFHFNLQNFTRQSLSKRDCASFHRLITYSIKCQKTIHVNRIIFGQAHTVGYFICKAKMNAFNLVRAHHKFSVPLAPPKNYDLKKLLPVCSKYIYY